MIGISMMSRDKRIFMNASALFAVANAKYEDHKRARDLLSKMAEEKVTFIVTNFILSETYTLMLRKIGLDKAIKYVESLRNTAEMDRISEEDEKRRWQIILRY